MKIAVIFGGMSTEHNVSIISGCSVIKHLNKEKYEIIPIYISENGNWYLYTKAVNEIEIPKIGEKINELEEMKNPIELLKKVDVVFPVLHGLYGEDGTIQGLFELFKIPYVGCKVLSSALCMDKAYAKAIMDKANIKQAKYMYIKKSSDKEFIYIDEKFNHSKVDLDEICKRTIQELELPVFVKPSNSGSSVGINKATNIEELKDAINHAGMFDEKILIEKAINGREIECAVIGGEDAEASCVGEILPAEEFYSFDAKYNNKKSKLLIPARIDDDISNEIRDVAKKAYKALDCSGLARVDLFLDRDTGEIYLNEVNTLPGFTTISMFPLLWEKCGKSYEELLDLVIEEAI